MQRRPIIGTRSGSIRPMVLFVVLTLVAGACGGDEETGDTAAASTTTAGVASTSPGTTATTEAATTTTTTPEPVLESPHGVLTVGLTGNLTTSNYWVYGTNGGGRSDEFAIGYMGWMLLYAYALPDFAPDPDLAAVPIPEPVPEGERWAVTIPLREGYLWSDGEEVTAHDYVFTMGVIEEFGLNSGDLGAVHPIRVYDDPETPEDEEVRWIEKVEALDDHTVKITFTPSDGPPGFWIYQLVMFGRVQPEHFWGPIVEACRAEEDPRGCLLAADGLGQPGGGPLILDSWEPGVGATLVANPNYYYRGVTHTGYYNGTHTRSGGAHDLDETLFGEPGGGVFVQFTDGPFVEEVHLVEYGSEEAAWDAFIRGDVAYVVGGVPITYRDRVLSLPDVEMAVNPSEGFRYLALNLRRAPMNDLAFRQALAIVINRQAIIDSVPEGSGLPLYSIIPQQNPSWYTDDIIKWGHEMTQPERVEAATEVLADAGYTWTIPPQALKDAHGEHTGEIIPGEGLTQPDGTPMPTIGLLTPIDPEDPLRQVQGEWITRFAAPLGIAIDWQPTDPGTIAELTFPPTADGTGWDMYTLGWGGGAPSLPCLWHQMICEAEDDAAAGGYNTPGYDDPDFETLSDALDAATSIDEAQPICAAMERNLTENLPYIVLWTNPITEAWRSHVEFPYTQVIGGIKYFGGMFGLAKVND